MLLWIGFAVLTAAVVAALTRPFFRRPQAEADPTGADIAVYRDQLSAVASERERGVLTEADAQSARTEIGRRVLQSARGQDEVGARVPPTRTSSRAAYVVAAVVPLASIAIYLALGSPSLPGRPHREQTGLPLEQASIEEIVSKVEARLREAPNDGRGWEAIAPVYLMQGRYADAADAYGKAMAFLGETPARLTGFATSSIRAANGIVNDGARGAFDKVLAAEPDRPDARFWIAMAKEQDGDLQGAANGYREVLAKAEKDAPWSRAAGERLKGIEEKLGGSRSEEPAGEPKPVN